MTFVRSAALALALALALGGVWTAAGPVEPWRVACMVGAFAAARLLRLKFWVSPVVFTVAWGEAAVVVGLHLAPAGWLPATAALGALVAAAVWRLTTGSPGPAAALLNASIVTIGAAAAASIGAVVADPYAAALTPPVAVGLALAAIGFLAATTTVAAVIGAVRYHVPVWGLLTGLLRRKLLMFVGSVAVGLTVIALVGADPRWLFGLPPAVWLLHQTYAYRLRASEDRRAWSAFARATRSLNQLEERLVAAAGVRGALDVFSVGHAEVEVRSAGGFPRRYLGDHTGQVRLAPADRADPPGLPERHAVSVPLLVGGAEIGWLRVGFPAVHGPAHRDEMAVQAYGDALAAALHDAATHQELRELLSRATHDAQHDALTGLLNRAAMLARGETALQLMPHASPVALLLLDVNHFREINDTLGHAAGDEALKITARRLAASAEDGELLARMGGDEFAILVTDMPAEPRDADRRALRRGRDLLDRLAAPAEVSGVPLSIEASVGMVVAPAGTVDMIELLRRAGAATHQAEHGSGPVAGYDSGRDAGSTDRLALLAELRSALARDDELILLLQPAVDLDTGAPSAVEALVRWRHPRRGLLAPQDFVRAAENSDLLGTFTRYVLDRALAATARWVEDGPEVPVSVNLSARSLLDQQLPDEVAALLRRHRVPARRLVLEITETVVMSELAVIDEVLSRLRGFGVRLAVDDFGTGYSSLAFLTRVPVDEVKVDRTFVTGMADSLEAAAIVRTTVELARELGLRVVAEGVETAAQRRTLAKLGCTAAQGFHIARPMPPDQIGATLRTLTAAAQARVIPLPTDSAG